MTDVFTETTFFLAGFIGGVAMSFFALVLVLWLLDRRDSKRNRLDRE